MHYCDIVWLTLERNRDHSVVFEIASKYFILDSFVDYDGYSTSSKGLLPTIVGNRLLEGINRILCAPEPRRKEQLTPQETEADLPMNVQKSPVEAWVGDGLLQGLGH